jgi:hypothetical protein
MQGIQVVCEDYVGGALRGVSIWIARIAHAAAALALAAALGWLAFGGAT